jgi:hypothetical protein
MPDTMYISITPVKQFLSSEEKQEKGHLHDSSHMDHNHTHPHEVNIILMLSLSQLFTPMIGNGKPMADMKVMNFIILTLYYCQMVV